jgi:O-antigen/teichoic acid export membrane protein
MNQFELKKKTISISYISQLLQYCSILFVVPLILNKLPADEIGIWYLFTSVSSLISLLDFGFGPSIQRNVSYVYSGATQLKKEGYVKSINENIDPYLLKSLFYTSRKIYQTVSLLVFIVALSAGTLYLKYSLNDRFTIEIVVTWLLFILSHSLLLYYGYLLSFIKGRGSINEYNYIVVFSKIVYIIILFIFVILGYSLISLILANLCQTLVVVVIGNKVAYNTETSKLLSQTDKFENLFSILWENAKNNGIVSFGVFLLSQAGVFMSGMFLKLDEVASLGLLLNVYSMIMVMSRVYVNTSMPAISSLWIKDQKDKVLKIFLKSQLYCYLIFFTSVISLLLLGNFVLKNIIQSNVFLPSINIILLYALFYFFELTHGNCCILISTTNNIPFVKASIIAGIVSVICTISFLLMGLGMLSFPLGVICGNLPYNVWRWPYYVYKLFR